MAHVELRRGGTCITLSKEDLEVRYIQYKICHGLIFSFLDIQNCFRFLLKSQCPIWLIRGEDNRAVFPKSNGRFVDDASHYEVAGEPVDAFKPATSVPASPFGGYAKPPTFTSTPTSFVAPNGVQKGKAKAFHKTIVVIALETFDPKRPCSSKMASNFNYSVVTQIVVLLDETKCDVPFVTEQVSKQLGFEATTRTREHPHAPPPPRAYPRTPTGASLRVHTYPCVRPQARVCMPADTCGRT